MGFLIGIVYAGVLCWGIKNGKSLSDTGGVKTYRRSSRTLSSRR